jgi:hypothetical protein
MADQARNRLAFLDRLDELIANPATREQEVHVALEHNLWVLGPQYALMASNKTLRRVIESTRGRSTGASAPPGGPTSCCWTASSGSAC